MDTLAVVVGTTLALWLLARAVKPAARIADDKRILEYGVAFKILGVVAFLFAGLGVVLCATVPEHDLETTAGEVLMVALGLYLGPEYFGVRISFDGANIHARSPWRATRVIPWTAITGITFSRLAQWYRLDTANAGVLRVSMHLSGRESLWEECRRRGLDVPNRTA